MAKKPTPSVKLGKKNKASDTPIVDDVATEATPPVVEDTEVQPPLKTVDIPQKPRTITVEELLSNIYR